MDNRIHWIDTCKGLLICMVIISHMSDISNIMGINIPVVNHYAGITLLYKCFYMSCFFIISGYVTNFNIEIKTFIIKRFKTLLLPALIFSILTSLFEYLITGNDSYKEPLLTSSFYLRFGTYWFLPTLFGCNVIFIIFKKHIIQKYKTSTFAEVILMFLISIIGLVLTLLISKDANINNPFYFRHILFYTIFLYTGYKAKNIKMSNCLSLILSLIYFFVIFSFIFLHIEIPQYTGWISFTTASIPALYFFTFTGSIMLIFVSKIINHSRILEYIGRNTLIIYLTHGSILVLIYRITQNYEYQHFSFFAQVLYLIVIFILTLVLSLIINHIVSSKYLRFLLGKF